MPHAAKVLEEESQPERIVSFKFMTLDQTFKDVKTGKMEPVQFIFEDHHVELQNGVTYDEKNLPDGIDIDALVNHLNTRPGYPVHENVPFVDPHTGKTDSKQMVSKQTGWDPRFECVNMRYA
jgi:hypothetical protein